MVGRDWLGQGLECQAGNWNFLLMVVGSHEECVSREGHDQSFVLGWSLKGQSWG